MLTPVTAVPRFDTNVEAVRVVDSMSEVVAWVLVRGGSADHKPHKDEVRDDEGVLFEEQKEHVWLYTRDGVRTVSFGDWIVRDFDGHFSGYTAYQFDHRYTVIPTQEELD